MSPASFYHTEDNAPLPATASEDEFIRSFRAARRHFVGKLALICLPFIAILTMIVRTTRAEHSSLQVVAAALAALVCIALMPVRNKLSRRAFRLATASVVWMQMALCVALLAGGAHDGVTLSTVLLGTACMTLLYPADRVSLSVLTTLNTCGAWMQLPANDPALAAVYSLFALFLLALRFFFDHAVSQQARREYRYRLMCAPPHLVLKGAGVSFEDHIEHFLPKQMFCVCLATDWRRYFLAKQSLNSSQLAMSVSEFYDLCDRILQVCLPKGNYFADWIADELCLTIYEVEGLTREELVAAAVDFSTRLLAVRAEFTRLYGLPAELDIGMSSGTSVIGFMGPAARRKATAVGEVPGRARRIHGAGRLLRMLSGPTDKLILDAQTAALLRHDFGQQRIELTAGQSIRDFSDRELYIVTPPQPEKLTEAAS